MLETVVLSCSIQELLANIFQGIHLLHKNKHRTLVYMRAIKKRAATTSNVCQHARYQLKCTAQNHTCVLVALVCSAAISACIDIF